MRNGITVGASLQALLNSLTLRATILNPVLFSQLEVSAFYIDCFSLLARALLKRSHEFVNRSNPQSAQSHRLQSSYDDNYSACRDSFIKYLSFLHCPSLLALLQPCGVLRRTLTSNPAACTHRVETSAAGAILIRIVLQLQTGSARRLAV